jgi:DNA topoisomerase-3
MGKPFSAVVRLSEEFKAEFDFGQAAEGEAAPDFSSQEPLGRCPKCEASVFEHGAAYVCEKAVGPARTCDFRSGMVILQQPVERAQMKKLLESGRTDLLARFISKKNRPFKAFLVKQPTGKIGFEFQPRANKEKAAGKPSTKTAVEKPAVEKPAVEKPAKKAAKKRRAA